jgi:hypothetical protein
MFTGQVHGTTWRNKGVCLKVRESKYTILNDLQMHPSLACVAGALPTHRRISAAYTEGVQVDQQNPGHGWKCQRADTPQSIPIARLSVEEQANLPKKTWTRSCSSREGA